MSDTLNNIAIPVNEWVDLYALSGVAVGTAISVENVSVCDIYLAVKDIKPAADYDAYNVLQRGNGVRLQNSAGDAGAWAFCNSNGAKVNVRPVSGGGFYPVGTGADVGGGVDPVGLKGEDGKQVTIQNPLPVDGSSIYCQDIDIDNSDVSGWTGDICDLFNDLHTEFFNDSTDNPKILFVHLRRPARFSALGLGSASGGNFSNVKVEAIGSGNTVRGIYDQSSDGTKETSKAIYWGRVVSPVALRFYFYTDDKVSLTNLFIPTLNSVLVESENVNSPIHTHDTDHSQRTASNTIFGDRIVASRFATLASQWTYGLRDRDMNIEAINGGSVSTDNALLTLATGTNPAGAVVAESVDYLRYVPGTEAFCFFTAVFSEAAPDSYQRAGIYDESDGFFVGYEGVDFTITRRRAGVDYPHVVDVTKIFNVEAFDPTMGNVYKISFGYLGFATITFEILSPGGTWLNLGKIEYPNSDIVTHITNNDLPIRGEIANTGNATNLTLSNGSFSAGIVCGNDGDPTSRPYAFDLRDGLGAQPTIISGNNLLVLFRNVETYAGRVNRIEAIATIISAATEGNKTSAWRFVFGPTVTNTPTWNPVSGGDSIIEYAVDGSIVFGTGEIGISWGMGKADSFFEIVEKVRGSIFPGTIVAIEVISGGSADIEFSMNWNELF